MELTEVTSISSMHDRQKDFPWFEKKTDIVVIGLGGIGSWISLMLSRIGHNLYLFDDDNLEAHNIGSQLYDKKYVGMRKSQAIRAQIRNFSMDFIQMNIFGRYDENSISNHTVFLALDNMETRRIAVEKWYQQYIEGKEGNASRPNVPILIDGRLEGEQGIIYALKSEKDYKRWMDEFFDDSEVDDGVCTMRATSYNGAMIAANMVALFNNHRANTLTETDIRVVPYKIEYGFPGFVYDIIM